MSTGYPFDMAEDETEDEYIDRLIATAAHRLTDPTHCSCGYGFSSEAHALVHLEAQRPKGRS